MSRSLLPVLYACGPATPSGIRSGLPFLETVARLKEAIEAEALWLIHELDPQMLAARGGYESLPIRQLWCFHPRYLVQVLEQAPEALVGAPLKLLVLAMPDGSVLVRCPAGPVFANCAELAELELELAGILTRILATVAI